MMVKRKRPIRRFMLSQQRW